MFWEAGRRGGNPSSCARPERRYERDDAEADDSGRNESQHDTSLPAQREVRLVSGGQLDGLVQRSVDAATRFNGGDLGYFTIDVMPPAYADVLKTAKPGDLLGPFQSDAGWVVMKVEDRRLETPVSLEAARPQIVRFLTYNEVRDLLEKLRRRSQVKLLIPPPVKSPDAAPEGPVLQGLYADG